MPTNDLHQKTIDIIGLWLKGLMPGYDLRCKDGFYRTYKDLMDGVDSIRIPEVQDDLLPVGGMHYADILLLDWQINPVRTVEVEVNTPISLDTKRALEGRGVEVVEVKVESVEDLIHNVFRLNDDKIGPSSPLDGGGDRLNRKPHELYRALDGAVQFRVPTTRGDIRASTPEYAFMVNAADRQVSELIHNLRWCAPELRRRLAQVLNALETVDSFYPTEDVRDSE